ncbi:sugar ABC transporter ATP-binding protein [Fodinisporobacter ferrooxydans]|uniref:Ribose/galactose/methyl galactoside import ATP-binding protein n=1 Tax=Fodinisporobacter ferrooxydans TaxID=2901836 RepID=A0ABY4CIS6_9BACL|nr:sugar ABC transporter ATP-binding protein [Alicyclobacillaceae bacterium MYW30-H2]
MENQVILEMNRITKSFPGVQALKDVTLKVRKGTVHALMGENGAGKSTLMKILAGIYQPDTGEILFNGESIKLKEPKDALVKGISMIHQELSPVLEMTIGENIFLGREPINPGTRFVNYKKMYQKASKLLESIGLSLNPRMKMNQLSVAEMQMVEIVKAISYDSQIIIMDEPTSAITDREVDRLFEIINILKKQDKAIIYISHKMDEIFKISDEITVFRDGNHIATKPAKALNNEILITMMVGRSLTEMYPKKEAFYVKETVFSVKDLSVNGKFRSVSFDLKKGEILGIAGLMGSGRTEVFEAVFGLTALVQGEIYIEGKKVNIKSPIDAIKQGLAFVTEDRKGQGLFLPMSVKANITMASLDQISNLSFIDQKEEGSLVDQFIAKLKVKSFSPEQIVETLSGGNQQKVVLAKWLLRQPKILILDEPTRGIDVGAKNEIYKLMTQLVQEGMSIIMISSEMPEVLGMSDRIIVFHEGTVAGELTRDDATQEKILSYATGHLMEVL